MVQLFQSETYHHIYLIKCMTHWKIGHMGRCVTISNKHKEAPPPVLSARYVCFVSTICMFCQHDMYVLSARYVCQHDMYVSTICMFCQHDMYVLSARYVWKLHFPTSRDAVIWFWMLRLSYYCSVCIDGSECCVYLIIVLSV